jgi:hypothetical protein
VSGQLDYPVDLTPLPSSRKKSPVSCDRRLGGWAPHPALKMSRRANYSVIIIIIITTCTLLDVAIPGDRNVIQKEAEKILKRTLQ